MRGAADTPLAAPGQTYRGTDGADRFFGGEDDDLIFGLGGNDNLSGFIGNDTINGGPGSDTLDGGAGIDLVDYGDATVGLRVDLDGGFANAGVDQDRIANFENIQGGAAGDLLSGSDFANLIRGGGGDDQLMGRGGDDTLEGGEGDDNLEGDAGDDRLVGGQGGDTYDLAHGGGRDTVVINLGDSPVGAVLRDVISGWGADDRLQFGVPAGVYAEITVSSRADGLAQANRLIGSGATYVAVEERNPIAGQPSTLVVYVDTAGDGGTAEDAVVILNAGLNDITPEQVGAASSLGDGVNPGGALTFEIMSAAQARNYNAAANDLVFSNSRAGATATLVGFNADGTVSVTSGAGIENQTVVFGPGIYGEANLIFADGTRVVIGTPGDDLMIGAPTHDRLFGGPGNDTLYGAGNSDGLFGGTGADLFVVPARDTTSTIVDTIYDWEPGDRLTFGGPAGATAGGYAEVDNSADAERMITSGQADVVAIRSTSGVGVIADVNGTNTVSGRVFLSGATLDQIDAGNIVASPLLAFPALPPVPAAATTAAPGPVTYIGRGEVIGGGFIEGNMDTLHLGDLRGGLVNGGDASFFDASSPDGSVHITLRGSGFSYLVQGNILLDMPTGAVSSFYGTIADPSHQRAVGFSVNVAVPDVAAPAVFGWILNDQTATAWNSLLGASDQLIGGLDADLLRGFTGNDTLGGNGGADTLWGGLGNDVIYAGAVPGRGDAAGGAATYLRGEEGDDNIYGGPGFDDINGNQGNDTAGGGPGDDWVVGGKDSDLLFGDAGNDLVYGNLGADTCDGGAGNDTVRGGQDNDVISGGAGADFMSGDKGDDTVTGGAGADIFHTFGDAGIDQVTDFHIGEGDRVQLDPGTQYTVSQVGADTVIDMTGGGKMILLGVQMSTLTGNWIFGA